MSDAIFWTKHGHQVDLKNPDSMTIEPRDIAWALSRLPRFLGHTSSGVPLSVAEHSIAVANEAVGNLKERPDWMALGAADRLRDVARCRLRALLDDASEAYTGDIPAPLKPLLGAFYGIQYRLQSAIDVRFGLAEHDGEAWQLLEGATRHSICIRVADLSCRVSEFSALFGGVAPPDLDGLDPADGYWPGSPWTSSKACVEYYGDLRRCVDAVTGVDIGELVPDGGRLVAP